MSKESGSRKTGLLRLRHLQEVTEAKGEEMTEASARFTRLADKASAPRVVQAFNLFQTPEELAARLASMFPAFGRTLEPSAGLGRLYRAVRKSDPACPVVLVDSSRACCGELYRVIEGDNAARLICGDFLAMSAERLGGLFDSVIMNPPFSFCNDVRHILWATNFLKPSGRLVAICANGPRQAKILQPMASQWIELPPGSFREEKTEVDAAIVVINK